MIGLRELADKALSGGIWDLSAYTEALYNESKWANRTIKEILSAEGVSQNEHRKILNMIKKGLVK